MNTILSYLFYAAGHIVSLPMIYVPHGHKLFHLYNWLMNRSIHHDPDIKPWQDPEAV